MSHHVHHLDCCQSLMLEVEYKRRGVIKDSVPNITDSDECSACHKMLTEDPYGHCSCGKYPSELFCGHVYHTSCIVHDDPMRECYICHRQIQEQWERGSSNIAEVNR